jgi:hypothetical protein
MDLPTELLEVTGCTPAQWNDEDGDPVDQWCIEHREDWVSCRAARAYATSLRHAAERVEAMYSPRPEWWTVTVTAARLRAWSEGREREADGG